MKRAIDFVLSYWHSANKRKPDKPDENVLTPENLHLYELESRVLYSAAPFVDPVGDPLELVDQADSINDLIEIYQTTDFASKFVAVDHFQAESFELHPDDIEPIAPYSGSGSDVEAETLPDDLPNSPIESLPTNDIELVVIDEDVEDLNILLDDLATQKADGRNLEVLVVGIEEDGVTKISERLAELQQVDSLTIVSHGTQSGFHLGDQFITNEFVTIEQELFTEWKPFLTETADIELYGCNLAATDEGQLLIESLSTLTGADVAASDDLTGHESLGGDWELEYQFGDVSTDTVFTEYVQASWLHTLNVFTVTNTLDDGSAGSLRWAINQANANSGIDTIDFNIAGTGPHVISVGSELPTIDDAIIIDGWSEPDYTTGNPVIVIDGSLAGANADGLKTELRQWW